MRRARAQFGIVHDECRGGPVPRTFIRDIGSDVSPSVTNDAEAVVRELLDSGKIQPGGKLFYYDSDDDLAELVYDRRGFTRFAPYTCGVGPSDLCADVAQCGGRCCR